MSELYWITRCDSICTIAIIITIIGMITSVGFLIFYFQTFFELKEYEAFENEFQAKKCKGNINICINVLKKLIPTTVFAMLVSIFVPSTKQAFIIYGVGGTIDYLKSNPTAKQLPDKCIKALDKWVDTLSTDKEEKNRKEK